MKAVHRLLCSVLHPNTEQGDCLRDIVDVTELKRGENGGQLTTTEGGNYGNAGL